MDFFSGTKYDICTHVAVLRRLELLIQLHSPGLGCNFFFVNAFAVGTIRLVTLNIAQNTLYVYNRMSCLFIAFYFLFFPHSSILSDSTSNA